MLAVTARNASTDRAVMAWSFYLRAAMGVLTIGCGWRYLGSGSRRRAWEGKMDFQLAAQQRELQRSKAAGQRPRTESSAVATRSYDVTPGTRDVGLSSLASLAPVRAGLSGSESLSWSTRSAYSTAWGIRSAS